MEKALLDFEADRPVDVAPVLRESAALGRAYDRVLADPLGGPPDEVLAAIRPEDIEAVLVHRAPAVMRDGEFVVQGASLKKIGLAKRGFGLVKIIFAHGEKGNKTPSMPPVTREDIVELPRTLRDYFPAEAEGTSTVWRILREDGKHLSIVTGSGQDKYAARLVTMFVDDKNAHLSQKKNRPSSLTLPGERSQDTSQGISVFTPDGSDGKKPPQSLSPRLLG